GEERVAVRESSGGGGVALTGTPHLSSEREASLLETELENERMNEQ
ncbi:hypothetical protein A2U01_0075373, partial [Trifolium medium]|nr:hypothetical protein [Trifolium medium]